MGAVKAQTGLQWVKCDDHPIRLGDVEKLGAMTLGVWCDVAWMKLEFVPWI